MSHRQTLHPSLVLSFVLVLLACGGEGERTDAGRAGRTAADAAEPASSSRSGDVEVIGTFEATLDGEPHTWYALGMDVSGERQATATWWGDDRVRTFVLGGMSERDLPEEYLEALARGPQAAYEATPLLRGTSLTVIFEVREDLVEGDLSAELTEDSYEALSDDPEVVYSSDVSRAGDVGALYHLAPGSVEIEWSGARGQEDARLEGTFEGTLTSVTGHPPIQVTDGRFEIRDAPFLEPGME